MRHHEERNISRSWEESGKKYMKLAQKNKLRWNPIKNCKSAGIIPYTMVNGELLFLFQKLEDPRRKKDQGWNDFGGKISEDNPNESSSEIAAREFSEETSCLFYLKETGSRFYDQLKYVDNLDYAPETVQLLMDLIPHSKNHFNDKIHDYVIPIYANSKETYISYFVNVPYVPVEDLPKAEDMHIDYETRYIRECKWFSFREITKLDPKLFHKRLQISKIQQRIRNYKKRSLF